MKDYNRGARKWRNLADAPDLGSGPARGGGSSPPFRTKNQWQINRGLAPDGLKQSEGHINPRLNGHRNSVACSRLKLPSPSSSNGA